MKMLHCLLTGLLLLSATVGFAQSRFGVSVTVAPTYSYASSSQTTYVPAVYVPSAPAGSTDPIPVALTSRVTAWGYVVGGMLHYRFSSNWSASTGLWYNQSRTADISVDSPATIDTPIRTSSHGLQVPLFINYRLTNKRLSPYFSVGGLASFRQHTLAQYESASGQSDINFVSGKSVAYHPVLGAGISRTFTFAVHKAHFWQIQLGLDSLNFCGDDD